MFVAPTSNIIVGAHTNGTYNRGNSSNNLGIKAIWRYRNMASLSGVSVNVEVTVDTIVNATLVSMDDDIALDQAGVQISHFFAPRISPDQNLNGTNRRGYVQFTMRFYINSTGSNSGTDADFGKDVKLANLNYVHYDIDGSDAGNVSTGSAGSWFRETGSAQKVSPHNPVVLANSVTELVAYDYADAGQTGPALQDQFMKETAFPVVHRLLHLFPIQEPSRASHSGWAMTIMLAEIWADRFANMVHGLDVLIFLLCQHYRLTFSVFRLSTTTNMLF